MIRFPRRVAIIGLGQIGGSLAMALRMARPALHLTGIDTSSKRSALLRGILNARSAKWEAAAGADLIVVCLHFGETIRFLQNAPRLPLIMDVCSAKRKILAGANRRKLRFIGGHPMAGNERPAEKGWDAKLFEGTPFFLCRSKGATAADLALATQLARAVGARPLVVDPAEHDRAVALTSHLPALLSAAYVKFARSVPSKYHGPGYRSFTRLARTSPALLQTFLDANGDLIRAAFRRWRNAPAKRILSSAGAGWKPAILNAGKDAGATRASSGAPPSRRH